MPTAAYHTLGCKVNQYDTQAMEELLSDAGYRTVPFSGDADVYLVNTCTVTGTGDKKSLQTVRRLRREHPDSRIILCGCLAQLRGNELLSTGADLILGTQRRNEIVSLLSRVIREGHPVCAVEPLGDQPVFERLKISRQSDHTRAVLKIQEGCGNRCSYCVIPQVRGPVRSRPLNDITEEALRLIGAGFREIVLTGIHLSSYGRDFSGEVSLRDVISALGQINGLLRVRLGSLEPTVITPEFVRTLRESCNVCPQFHLALQSGSDSVLRRMRRQYNTLQYIKATEQLRDAFPHAALTTDILTGFPGETQSEFIETQDMIRRICFARIHVFPYSPRPNTDAAAIPDQLPDALRQERARILIALGEETARIYRESWLNQETELLPEEIVEGCYEGYTPEYLRVRLPPGCRRIPGEPVRVRIVSVDQPTVVGEII